ncbi:MAG: hypothetical protein J6386_13660 [Candidatus Synoicihabitans palmerolidicus]|nr:hypothetical protein [Candidatus Synoicihabitans palmerolidicus]
MGSPAKGGWRAETAADDEKQESQLKQRLAKTVAAWEDVVVKQSAATAERTRTETLVAGRQADLARAESTIKEAREKQAELETLRADHDAVVAELAKRQAAWEKQGAEEVSKRERLLTHRQALTERSLAELEAKEQQLQSESERLTKLRAMLVVLGEELKAQREQMETWRERTRVEQQRLEAEREHVASDLAQVKKLVERAVETRSKELDARAEILTQREEQLAAKEADVAERHAGTERVKTELKEDAVKLQGLWEGLEERDKMLRESILAHARSEADAE